MDNSDIAVLDRQGKPVLAVEAKSRFDATSESWAAGTLRNLLAHGSVPDVPYFLFALPDFFYLWKDPKRKAERAFLDGSSEALRPDYSVPAWDLLNSYLGEAGTPPHEVGSYAMRTIVEAFVADVLSAHDLTRETAPPNWGWLFESGLYDVTRGGSLAGTLNA